MPLKRLLIVACASALGLGCRTYDHTVGVDDGAPDAQFEAPTRLEPPVVQSSLDVSVETVAGSEVQGSADGVGAAAQFDNPVGVFLDASGALLVTEYDGGRLRKIASDGTTTTLTAGLSQPFALFGTEDGIYVQTDRDRDGITGPSTGTIWRIAPTGGAPELIIDSLGRPRGLAILPDGRMVVSDRNRHTISILNLADRSLVPLAGTGIPGYVDGPGGVAQFNEPYGVAILPDGNILVADSFNHSIRKVTLTGEVSTFAGDGYPGMRDDPDKARARFDRPVDLAIDVAGNTYVSDADNHRIRRVTSAGGVQTIAGDGTQGYADGVGRLARFFGQEQIEVTPDGRTIYVSDGNGGDGHAFHRIRRIRVP